MRFSLFTLGIAIAFLALLLAAASYRSPIWVAIVSYITVLTLLTGLVAAINHRGTRRAFWIGFAVFGWAFLFLQVVKLGEDYVLRTYSIVEPILGFFQKDPEPGRQRGFDFAEPFAVYRVFQYGLALIAAFLGGIIGQWISDRNPAAKD